MSYALTVRTAQPFEATATAVRDALAAQGFGILTEIDMAGTLKAELDVDVPAQVILGACNPPLAYRALQAEGRSASCCPATSSSATPATGRRSSRRWTRR